MIPENPDTNSKRRLIFMLSRSLSQLNALLANQNHLIDDQFYLNQFSTYLKKHVTEPLLPEAQFDINVQTFKTISSKLFNFLNVHEA